MKFGIFFELSVPRPWTPEPERQVYENAMEQARVADELGFDWVWAVEHHFLEEYSHCSAPEVLLAGVARETQRIRVGHGVTVCVPQMNHPVRLAERAAALDILSGGRLEFGTGRIDLDGARRLPGRPGRDEEDVGRVRPRDPEDVDAGALRVRGPVVLDAGARRAAQADPEAAPADVGGRDVTGNRARRGRARARCLGLAVSGPDEQERIIAEYHRRVANCDPVGEVVCDQVATLNFLFCHEDRDVAADRGLAMVGTFTIHNAHLLFTREAYPTTAYQLLANLAPRASSSGPDSPGEQTRLRRGCASATRTGASSR